MFREKVMRMAASSLFSQLPDLVLSWTKFTMTLWPGDD